MTFERHDFDGVVVVGAGLAGLSAALAAAPRRVLLLSPTALAQACASAWAQGGIAAALAPEDDPEQHALDTVAAGAGLVDPAMARLLTTEGPAAVRALAALGAPFDREADGGFALSLEAAHGRARVARVGGDGAGRAILAAVTEAVRASPDVTIREGVRMRGLVQDRSGAVRGVLVADGSGRPTQIVAPAVLLATGGLGGLYAVSTVPSDLQGEGLGLAALAGAGVADPEFVQFHPTGVDIGLDPAPLATEALRGHGAVLVDETGRRFMPDYDPRAELAPRDVVARALEAERRAGRRTFLDARASVGESFPDRYPTVFAACMAGGVDPRREPIPVAPAAHYHMGGIDTDAHGAGTLPGLYAAGECASTGVHGANRLASNSLLEAAVFGGRAGAAAAQALGGTAPLLAAQPAPTLPPAALRRLRASMSRGAALVRTGEGLAALVAEIETLQARCGAAPGLIAAELVARAAMARRESRGGHFRADHPESDGLPRRTRVTLTELREAGGAQLAA